MGNPAVLTVNGTGSAIWTPDWMQNPFSIGFQVVGATATTSVNLDVTYDNPNSGDVNGVASPHWSTIASAAGIQNALFTGTFTSPIQGMRINVITALATSIITATLIQATFGR